MQVDLTARIIHRDGDILAIDKPAGVPTIPERDPSIPSLIKVLEENLGTRLFVVHRLDKEASGIVIFGLNAEARRALMILFEQHKAQKCFTLLVHGRIDEESGVIDRKIRQFGSGRMGIDDRAGKPSRTGFRIVERFPGATLVDAQALTSRRHQVRVHFYCIGHPIVGDSRYGDAALQIGYPRLMLHASSLSVVFPGRRRLELIAPVPPAFAALIEAARVSTPPFH